MSVIDLDDALRRARVLAESGGRHLLGIAGAPGAGKSTVAQQVAESLGASAVVVPMDGFHLAQTELERQGTAGRKGAIDTFDAGGFVSLLTRVARAEEDVVYAPAFDRRLEEPIAGSIPVRREVPLVVVEGNYLLVDHEPWAQVRALMSEVWYVDLPDETRIARLVARHIRFGRGEADARAHALGSDQRNAELIAKTRGRADVVVTCPG